MSIRTSRTPDSLRHSLLLVILISALPAPAALATDILWDNASCGGFGNFNFNDTNCWTGNVVPGNADVARFDGVGALIEFNGVYQNQAVQFDSGNMAWDLQANTYTLTNPGSSLVVRANLLFQGSPGTLVAPEIRIDDAGLGSPGTSLDTDATVFSTTVMIGSASSASSNRLVNRGIINVSGDMAVGFGSTDGNQFRDEYEADSSNNILMVGGDLTIGATGNLIGAGEITVGGWKREAFSNFELLGEAILTVDGNLAGSGVFEGGINSSESNQEGTIRLINGASGSGAIDLLVTSLDVDSGATYAASGDIDVFVGSQMNVTNGGQVTGDAGLSIGELSAVTVDGAGSSLMLDGTLQTSIGTSAGSVEVSNGGNVVSALGIIGAGDSGETVTVDGAGSNWSTDNLQLLDGTLNITNGGTVTVADTLEVTTGTAVLNLNNETISTDKLTIVGGGGPLTLNSGTLAFIGPTTEVLDGSGIDVGVLGRVMSDGGTVDVASGFSNNGTLEAANGGTVNITSGTSTPSSIARAVDGGTLNVQNAAALNGGFVEADGAGSTVDVKAGGTIQNAIVQAFDQGVLNVDGTVSGGSIRVFFGGTLTGSGDVGTVINSNGGIVSAGNSPGTLSMDDYTQDSFSTLLVELAGLDQGAVDGYDWLDVSGTAQLDGILDIDLLGGFDPQAGDFFDILTATSILGNFSSLSLPSIAGLQWELQTLFDEVGTTDVLRLSVAAAAVPVPASVWLFGSALALLGWIRRRKAT